MADQHKFATPLATIEQSNESDTDVNEKSPQLKKQLSSRPGSVLSDNQINLDISQTHSTSSDSMKSKQSKSHNDSPVSYHLEDLKSVDGGLVNLNFLTNKHDKNSHENKSFEDD